MRKLTIASFVLISIAGIFVTQRFSHQSEAQDALALTAVQNAPPKGVLRELGTVESAFGIPIVNKLPGTTTILSLVRNGAEVKAGDLLFELDDSLLQEQIQTQKIKLVKAEANAALAEKNFKLHQLETENPLIAAKTSLAIAEISKSSVLGEGGELDLKQRELNRELKLLKNKIGMIEKRPESQVEPDQLVLQYELTLLDLRNQLETVQEQLQHLDEHVRPLAAAKHDGEIEVAATHLKQQEAVREFQTEQLQAALAAARLPIELEQQRLEELQNSLANCRVVAPRDGAVVYANSPSRRTTVIEITEGATLRERQKVMSLVDPQNRKVSFYVQKSQLDKLKVGQDARVRVDALPDRIFSGAVAEIADTADPNRSRADGREYAVVVKIEKPEPMLQPGMTCLVDIDVSK